MSCADVDYKIIGLKLGIHRHKLGLTQEQLAEKAELSKQFICNLECGRAIPSLKTVLSLCAAMDIEPNALLQHSYKYNPDHPCTLRDDHDVFQESLSDRLFAQKDYHVCIDPQDLPAFDIILPDLSDDL